MDRKNFEKIQKKKKSLIPYNNEDLNEPLLNSKVPFEKMKTGDMVILNTPFDKNDQNKNLFTITKINFKGKRTPGIFRYLLIGQNVEFLLMRF